MFTDPTLTLAGQIFWIVDVFCKTLAAEACKRRVGMVSVAVWNRTKRFERRFSALYAMWKAGTLPQARVRKSASPRPSPQSGQSGEGACGTGGELAACDAARLRPASLLPRAFAWLYKVLPISAGTFLAAMDQLIRDHPEMQKFVAAAPQVGRMLRPMCQMVGLKPPEWLALPRRRREPGLRRQAAAPRLRRTPREIAKAAMERSLRTGKPVDPRKIGAVPFGCVLHWPRDDNCPPPEIGYGGRSFPSLPKDYVPPKDWE